MLSPEDVRILESSVSLLVEKMYPRDGEAMDPKLLVRMVLARPSFLAGVSWLVSQVDNVKNTEVRLSLVEDRIIWKGVLILSLRDPAVHDYEEHATGSSLYDTVPTYEEMKTFIYYSRGGLEGGFQRKRMETEIHSFRKRQCSGDEDEEEEEEEEEEEYATAMLNENNVYYFCIKRLLIVYKEKFSNSCHPSLTVDVSHFKLDDEEVHPSQILQYMPLWSHGDPWTSGNGSLLGSSVHASNVGVRKDDEKVTVAWKGRNFVRYDLRSASPDGNPKTLVLPMSSNFLGDRIRFKYDERSRRNPMEDEDDELAEPIELALPRSFSFPMGSGKWNRYYDGIWNHATNPTTCKRHLKERLESIPHTSLYEWHTTSKPLQIVVSRNRMGKFPLDLKKQRQQKKKPTAPLPFRKERRRRRGYSEIAAGIGGGRGDEADDDEIEIVKIRPYDPVTTGGNEILIDKKSMEPVVVKETIEEALWKELESTHRRKNTVAHFNVLPNGDVLCILEDAAPIFPSPPAPSSSLANATEVDPWIGETTTSTAASVPAVTLLSKDPKTGKVVKRPGDDARDDEEEDEGAEEEEVEEDREFQRIEGIKRREEEEKRKRRRRAFNVLWYRFEKIQQQQQGKGINEDADDETCVVTAVGRFYFSDFDKEGMFFLGGVEADREKKKEEYPVLVRKFIGKDGKDSSQVRSDEKRYKEAYEHYLVAREKREVERRNPTAPIDATSADDNDDDEEDDDVVPTTAGVVDPTAPPETVATLKMMGTPKATPIINRILTADVGLCNLSTTYTKASPSIETDCGAGLKLSFSLLIDKSFRVAEKRDVLYEGEEDLEQHDIEEEEEGEQYSSDEDYEGEGGGRGNVVGELERRRIERKTEKKKGQSREAYAEIGVKDEIWSFTLFLSATKTPSRTGRTTRPPSSLSPNGGWISPSDRLRIKGMMCTRVNEEHFKNFSSGPKRRREDGNPKVYLDSDLDYQIDNGMGFPTVDDRRLGKSTVSREKSGDVDVSRKLCLDSFTPFPSSIILSSRSTKENGVGSLRKDAPTVASTCYRLTLSSSDVKSDTEVVTWTESYERLLKHLRKDDADDDNDDDDDNGDEDELFHYKLKNPYTEEGGRTMILGSTCGPSRYYSEWDPYEEDGKTFLKEFLVTNVQVGSRTRFGGFDTIRSLGDVRATALTRPAESFRLYRPPPPTATAPKAASEWFGDFECDKVWLTRHGGIAVTMETSSTVVPVIKVFRMNRMTILPTLGINGGNLPGLNSEENETNSDDRASTVPPLTLLNVTRLKDERTIDGKQFYGFKQNELGSLFETREHIVLLVKQNPSFASFVSNDDGNGGERRSLKLYVKMWKSSWIHHHHHQKRQVREFSKPYAKRADGSFGVGGSFDIAGESKVPPVRFIPRDDKLKMLSRTSGKADYGLYRGNVGEDKKKKKTKEKKMKPSPVEYDLSTATHDYDLTDVCTNPKCSNVRARYVEDKSVHAQWHFCSPDCRSSLPAALRKK